MNGAVSVLATAFQALKASGAIVSMNPEEFQKILEMAKDPLVVVAKAGFLSKKNQYLTSHKGLFFYCKAESLNLPSAATVINAKKIWIPDF